LGYQPTSQQLIFSVDLESNGGHAGSSVSATGSPAGENYFVERRRIWHPSTSDDVERRRRSVAFTVFLVAAAICELMLTL